MTLNMLNNHPQHFEREGRGRDPWARVNQHPLPPHEGWMISDQKINFY
jgi:hypothetical protein